MKTDSLIALGIVMLFCALALQTVTLAGGSYMGVLLTALALTALADVCFIVAFRRGGWIIRCTCVVLLLPTLFVVGDFLRRASFWFD